MALCGRMAWSYSVFCSRDTFAFRPVDTSRVAPAAPLAPYNVALLACSGSPLVGVDQNRATLRCAGQAPVAAESHHFLGNMFLIVIPELSFLKPTAQAVELVFECDGLSFTHMLDLRMAPSVPSEPTYGPHHMPLHYATLTGNVSDLILTLESSAVDAVKAMDECGVQAAALALFFGKRCMFSLLLWKMYGWPVLAVCQLLRSRLELESRVIGVEQFDGVRDAVHEVVFNSGPSLVYRPVKYQTGSAASSQQDHLAIMLLQEIPYTEHVTASPSQRHRRGSLDLILSAIDTSST